TSAIYMTVVEGFRPTWKSMIRVAVWMNLYALIVYFINDAIGSNYLMINHKPPTASLLDLLPDWPLYILYMELIGVVTMILLYLPIAFTNWRNSFGGNTVRVRPPLAPQHSCHCERREAPRGNPPQ
ncbi:TIGR02206 family membrane protein, partial [Chloroflexi bacterium CFX6]|nr:TIGR02206 family membrane protein [Chloroflexi bacterium CFX6]